MLTADTLQFLYDLSQNNNREWFEKNKSRYESVAKLPFERCIEKIIQYVQDFEPTLQIAAKACMYRQHRDVRFSTDKSPYKTHLAAIISKYGRKMPEYPAFYFHLEYGNLMLGGGAYFLEKPAIEKVRTAILQHPDTFTALLAAPDFMAYFGELKGEKNKVLPPAFKEAAKTMPLLANKQFYFMAELDPEMVTEENFELKVANMFRAAQPLNQFLRAALGYEV